MSVSVAYLSSPYAHPDPKVKDARLAIVTRVSYALMRRGIYVYSPLTHNIPIDRLGFHGDWETWRAFDHSMLSRCDRILVLKLPGWDQSKGVAAEIAFAKEKDMPIEWMECPDEMLQETSPASSPTMQELLQRLLALYEERDWKKFHSPKNLAMNLGVEAGEVMEHFRWLTEAQSFIESPEILKEIEREIGDVFNVLIHLSHVLGIEPVRAAYEKLDIMILKYPADKCKGSSLKYTAYADKQ